MWRKLGKLVFRRNCEVQDELRFGGYSVQGNLPRDRDSHRTVPVAVGAQLAVTFHALAARWQDQLSQLQTLKPPANLATTFNTLTGAASRAEADLNAIVAAAETHNKSAAEQASASLVTDIESAKAASTTITP